MRWLSVFILWACLTSVAFGGAWKMFGNHDAAAAPYSDPAAATEWLCDQGSGFIVVGDLVFNNLDTQVVFKCWNPELTLPQ